MRLLFAVGVVPDDAYLWNFFLLLLLSILLGLSVFLLDVALLLYHTMLTNSLTFLYMWSMLYTPSLEF